MILPDLNILLYAYNPHARDHHPAREWWTSALHGQEIIGLPNEVILGFVRIATTPRLGAACVPLKAARRVVQGWLEHPGTRVLLPREDHASRVMALMTQAGLSGVHASDASLAVYAIEHRATLYTNDADFARFPDLEWANPLPPPSARQKN